MPPSSSPPAADPARRQFHDRLGHRPRLVIAAGLTAAVYFATPGDFREATRVLIAWNVGAVAFLAMIAAMMARGGRGDARRRAPGEDENLWMMMLFGLAAALAATAAIVWQLGPVKDMAGWSKAAHLALVGATVFSAWTFVHTLFALHYAGDYYRGTEGGLDFPGGHRPEWSDFLYQAFAIGCSSATSDVNTTSASMRRVTLAHGVVSFFFNTIILALTINIGAGLI